MAERFSKWYTLKNGKEMLVRELTPDDAEEMISYVNTVDTESPFMTREPGEFTYTVRQEREIIESRMKSGGTFWIVGVIDGQIVANCDATRVHEKARLRHRAVLGISVLQDFWGLGIARILITESIAWCKQNGFEQLELEVISHNERAVGLYKGLGFEVTGTGKRMLKYSDGTYGDNYYMWLPLKD